MSEQPMLPIQRPLARRTDPATSHEAGESVAPKLHKLQSAVLGAISTHGPMSARQCERLPAFAGYSPSTIRKRVSELAKADPPYLVEVGKETEYGRTPCIVYRVRGMG